MHSQSNTMLRTAGVAVVALIATSAIALSVVLTHEDTAMAQGKAWPSKPATATTTAPAPSTTPSTAPSTAQTSPVAENSPVATTPAPSTPSAKPAVRGPITYKVKRGDNLTVIADWFKLHGYGDLYERNRKIIGADPDLIRPGQKITISSAGATTSR